MQWLDNVVLDGNGLQNYVGHMNDTLGPSAPVWDEAPAGYWMFGEASFAVIANVEQLDKAATPFAAEFARFPADAFVVMRRNLAAANGAIVVGTMPESHGVGRGVLLEVGRKID